MPEIPNPVPQSSAQGATLTVIDRVSKMIAGRLKVNDEQVRTPAAIRKEIVRRALTEAGPLRQPHADIVSIIQDALAEAAEALGVKLSCSRDTVSRDIHEVLKAVPAKKQPEVAKPRAKNTKHKVVGGTPNSAISPNDEARNGASSKTRLALQENLFGGSD